MNNKSRPRLKINLKPVDYGIEMLGILLLIVLWLSVKINYAALPDTIPIHFNSQGVADGFGPKTNLWILPVIATAFFILLTLLNFFPHVFNYPFRITEKNAYDQYFHATRMLRLLKLSLTLTFMIIVFQAVYYPRGMTGGWILALLLALLFAPLIYFFVNAYRYR